MTLINRFRDFVWVLVAYFRGKVLKQKAYQPQGNFFSCMPGGTSRRMVTLIRWWGCRPVTLEELLAIYGLRSAPAEEINIFGRTSIRAPYLSWNGEEWKLGAGDWDATRCSLTVRK